MGLEAIEGRESERPAETHGDRARGSRNRDRVAEAGSGVSPQSKDEGRLKDAGGLRSRRIQQDLVLAEARRGSENVAGLPGFGVGVLHRLDRKSTRLNSSHRCISYD